MYGSKFGDINSLRYEKFIDRFSGKQGEMMTSYNGVDMTLLPPCRESLKMHVRRANYQALIWKKADQATYSPVCQLFALVAHESFGVHNISTEP